MLELSSVLAVLAPSLGSKLDTLIEIAKGIYCISSGGVTMKNISRWTGPKGSYRSIQRFFRLQIDWLSLNLLLFRGGYLNRSSGSEYVLALDEVVEEKAGKETYGVGWFYSSIFGKVIRSVSTHAISLVDTDRGRSYVLKHSQTVNPVNRASKNKGKRSKNTSVSKSKNSAVSTQKRKSGRPKGSKNKQNLKQKSALFTSFEDLLVSVFPFLQALGLCVKYVLGDGAYGNKTCALITDELDLFLISKLNRNTGLYLPYQGEYRGKGRPRKYGKKLNYENLAKEYRVDHYWEDGIEYSTYQIKGCWTKHMPRQINVVILITYNPKTEKSTRVLFFSTDLNIRAGKLLKYYSLRFQIEFNFRDAKQYFGLADFKNIREQQVDNAIGLSFFMDNLSLILCQEAQEIWQEETISVQDLKAWFRAEKYLFEILNTLEIPPKSILIQEKLDYLGTIGAINRTKKHSIVV